MGWVRAAIVGIAALALSAAAAMGGPLHDATEADDGVQIDALIAAGADINELNENHETALFFATGKYWTLADKLLTYGADPLIRDNQGRTVLHGAVAAENEPLVAMLIGQDGSGTPVRIEIDDQDARGRTPLMVAAEDGLSGMLISLIFYGADLEKTDLDGRSALTIAGEAGNEEIVTVLLRRGAVCQDVDPSWKAECDKRKAELSK